MFPYIWEQQKKKYIKCSQVEGEEEPKRTENDSTVSSCATLS